MKMSKSAIETLLDNFEDLDPNFKHKKELDALYASVSGSDGSHVLSPCTIEEVLVNTSKKLSVKIRDNFGPVYIGTWKRNGNGKYDYEYNGSRLLKNKTAEQMLWEFDSVFVSMRNQLIKPKCITIPNDLQTEVFITRDGNTTTYEVK